MSADGYHATSQNMKINQINHVQVSLKRTVASQVVVLVCLLRTGMQEDGTLAEIRPAGVEEESRFRANKFPYAEAHGIGLSGSGLDVSLAAMVGKNDAQIKREAGSKLKNWWLTDIEKVCSIYAAPWLHCRSH